FPKTLFQTVLTDDILPEAIDDILHRSYKKLIKNIFHHIFEILNDYCINLTDNNMSSAKRDINKNRLSDIIHNTSSWMNLLMLYQKDITLFNEEIAEKSISYILKLIGIHVADDLLRIYIYRSSKWCQLTDDDYKLVDSDEVISLKERQFLFKHISNTSHLDIFNKLYQSLGVFNLYFIFKSWTDFINIVSVVKDRSMNDVPLKLTLNKTNEKVAKEMHLRYILKVFEQILTIKSPSIQDYAKIFQNSIYLAVLKSSGYSIIFPTKFLNLVIEKITKSLDADIKILILDLKPKISSLLAIKTSDTHPQFPETTKANFDTLINLSIETIHQLLSSRH
ncbi:hypothetical protein HZS_870, partial [Henneguya salminicola]